ncbi:MAG TPA: NADH-quinone oxidoreductase subunit C [Thermodesulfovibrionales bacterium]|nr:NADH-quinone oxidoreductase subunit C [Thermodesulfovibrionales bacterium]
MERILKKALKTREHLNERYLYVSREEFKSTCMHLYVKERTILRLMFATDERKTEGAFNVYVVFSVPGADRFDIVVLSLNEDDLTFSSITPEIPAAHWYEREIQDMFGLTPKGHPDLRRLVFHDSFPKDSHPLRKDWSMSEADLKEWGEGTAQKEPYHFMKVEGEGVYEIPVGPVHAGIIEPGHFRFSAVGETIFFLEPRLFYTHKGTEKLFETLGFAKGVSLSERVSGTSSFSHSVAYCTAVERMAGVEITEKAMAVRTLALELERLYNHIGDIGNMCAGTGFAAGYAKGAVIKERLLQLNERISGSRYLRGMNSVGGVTRDLFSHADDILMTLDFVTKEYKEFMKFLLGTVSHVERLENTGRLSKEIAVKLGVTGVAARASGVNDDIRKVHPHLLYDRLEFEAHTMARGDVFGRMMIRAEEAECSIAMIHALLEKNYKGILTAKMRDIPPYASALGYTETARGSVFYWVMSGSDGNPLRVKLRSPSFCNWPAVPFAVHGNIVPDFPLCNKSFNLSYSGCDM